MPAHKITEKQKKNALRVGRHFQEVIIAGLTIAAGFTISNPWLFLFGLMILAATGIKELDILRRCTTRQRQILIYVLFMAGYVGGGSNFIWAFFRPEMQFKAFVGLGVLAFGYIVKGFVEKAENSISNSNAAD